MNGCPRTLVALAILALSGATGCGRASVVGISPSEARLTDLVLRPGDMVRISVWPNSEWSGEYEIDEAGYAHLPVLGVVPIAGIPISRVREDLRRGYAETTRTPVVNVTPVFSVIVAGAVQRPGVYNASPTSSLFDVIGLAGGFHGSADTERVRIVRPGEVIRYDALRALEHGEGLDAVQLRSGDQIVVPQARQPINWRNMLALVQTISLIYVTYDRVTR